MIKLLKFYSDSCAPCKAMAPIVSDVLKEFDNVELVEMNLSVGDNGDQARMLGLRGIPSFVVTKDGDPVSIKTGAMTKDAFKEFLVEATK